MLRLFMFFYLKKHYLHAGKNMNFEPIIYKSMGDHHLDFYAAFF